MKLLEASAITAWGEYVLIVPDSAASDNTLESRLDVLPILRVFLHLCIVSEYPLQCAAVRLLRQFPAVTDIFSQRALNHADIDIAPAVKRSLVIGVQNAFDADGAFSVFPALLHFRHQLFTLEGV